LSGDFAQVAAARFNTVRIPHTVPPISLLDTAFRYGLRVMVGLSAEQYVVYLLDPKKQAPDVRARIREKVQTVNTTPRCSVTALAMKSLHRLLECLEGKTVEHYLRQLYDVIKAADPSGIVTYVNYPSTEYLQLPFLDIVCFQRLFGIGEPRPEICRAPPQYCGRSSADHDTSFGPEFHL
jgi:hypothetical protein